MDLQKLLDILRDQRQQMFNVCFQFTDIGKKMVVDLQGKELKNKYQTDPDKKVNIDLDHELKKLEEYFSNELDKIMK